MKHLITISILSLFVAPLALAVTDFAPQTPDARPVSFISATTAVVNWQTDKPCETKLQLREGNFIAGTPGYEDVWKKGREIKGDNAKTTEHSITLTGLKPGTRYYYRVYDPEYQPKDKAAADREKIWSYDPPWRREFAFATKAEPGEKTIVRIPIKVLICPNIIQLDSVKDDTPIPEKMSKEDIQIYEDQMLQTVLFYWINSRMNYWMELNFFTEEEWLKVGGERDELPDFYKGLQNSRDALRVFDPLDISNHGAGWPLKDEKIYTGQVIVNCVRTWNDEKKQWEFQGSGGWTFGADWMQWGDKSQTPAPGRSGFLGGSDMAWLLCHEYHHQKESQYGTSGLNTENDRVIFCHFAPIYKSAMGNNWRWDTALDHGEHWDGIAWELRAPTDTQYLRNMFGEIYVAKDTDNDGIPDDDFRLPLDEARFGSDPKKVSSDGTGMTDLEKAMTAKWVPSLLTNMRQKVYNPGYAPMWKMASKKDLDSDATGEGYAWPKAKVKDSDGDGVNDIDDPYPIYPWEPIVKQAAVTVDGKNAEWESLPVIGHVKVAGVECTVKMAYDRDNLYYMMQLAGETRGITLNIDGDADGWYVGNDNLDVRFGPNDEGKFTVTRAVAHLCASRGWPFFDTDAPVVGTHKVPVVEDGKPKLDDRGKPVMEDEKWEFARTKRFGGPEDVEIASTTDGGKTVVEVAIPSSNGAFPLRIGPNHTFAQTIYVGIPGRGAVSIYEPYTLFQVTAE